MWKKGHLKVSNLSRLNELTALLKEIQNMMNFQKTRKEKETCLNSYAENGKRQDLDLLTEERTHC